MKMIFWNAMDFDQFGSLRGSIYILFSIYNDKLK